MCVRVLNVGVCTRVHVPAHALEEGAHTKPHSQQVSVFAGALEAHYGAGLDPKGTTRQSLKLSFLFCFVNKS